MNVAAIQRMDFVLTGILFTHLTTSSIPIISATSSNSRLPKVGPGAKPENSGDVVQRSRKLTADAADKKGMTFTLQEHETHFI
jgi:hypothetical protein